MAAGAVRCQARWTRPAERIRLPATHSSSVSVPSHAAVTRVANPPTIQPRMAPLPMNPKARLASRVVSTKLARVQTWAGASTLNTPTQR